MFLRNLNTKLITPCVAVAAVALLGQTEPACAVNTVWSQSVGGTFQDSGNWTAGAPVAGDTGIINNNLNHTIEFSGSVDTQDLFLRNTAGTITLDVDPLDLGNKYTMSRFTIVGAAAGETNHLVAASGELETGIILIGNATGSDNNTVDVTGAGTYWRANGGSGGTAAVRVGSNGGSGNTLNIINGGAAESTTQTIIGLQGGSNNTLIVSGVGSSFSNAQSISLGDNTTPLASQTNNQLKVLDGGYVTTRELIIGTTAPSPGNTVLVSGPGSHLNVRGGQQFPATEGGQKHDIGRASSNNSLIAENGAVIDGNAIFQLGREATSLDNLLSITDSSLSSWGIQNNQGTVLIENSSVEITRKLDSLALVYLGGSFLAETSLSVVDFRSGSLATVNASVSNGTPMTIGDGGAVSATYRMKLNPQGDANGTHTFADGLLLNSNGRLEGSGNIVGSVSGLPGSQVSIGLSNGFVAVTGDWDNSDIAMTMEIGDISQTQLAGDDFDYLGITGTFTHGGSITIDLSNLVHADSPKTVQLIGLTSVAGNPNDTAVSFTGGGALSYQWTGQGLFVDVPVATILVGDLNGDGFVGIEDLNIVLGNWNQNVTPGDPLVGDPSGDGFVGIEDLNQVLGNWNAGTPPTASSVPEPASLLVLTLCGTAILSHRQRD
ncbi:MAG: hypothetical protein R3C45_07175 [Phycisphaerales bacterium]